MRKALLALVATTALSLPVYAGYKSTSNVSIGSNYASGALGTARNSSDTKQQIGCRVDLYAYSTPTMFCYARNSSGTSKTCTTDDPGLIDLFHALNGDSVLYFEVDSYGSCSRIRVTNASEFEPKVR